MALFSPVKSSSVTRNPGSMASHACCVPRPTPVPPSVPPAWPSGPREPVAQVFTPVRGSQDVTVTVKPLATESNDVGFLLCPLVAM